MKRLCLLAVLLCTLFVGAGCLTESDKAQWREAWKDWNGDNMKMSNEKAHVAP
jgi:hypothetical protein